MGVFEGLRRFAAGEIAAALEAARAEERQALVDEYDAAMGLRGFSPHTRDAVHAEVRGGEARGVRLITEAIRGAVAEERAACARIADERRKRYGDPDGEWSRGVADAFAQIAAAIRARG